MQISAEKSNPRKINVGHPPHRDASQKFIRLCVLIKKGECNKVVLGFGLGIRDTALANCLPTKCCNNTDLGSY